MESLFVSMYIKFFFLLSPFFGLSAFLSLTQDMTPAEQRKVAFNSTLAIVISAVLLFYVGTPLFKILGITLDGFRVGAGSLLFLSAVSLVSGKMESQDSEGGGSAIAVVPLAIPITIGPATIGTILIFGANGGGAETQFVGICAIVAACLTVGALFFAASPIKKMLGNTGLTVMIKITGLVLSAIAAQLVFTGIKNFMK